MCSSDPSIRRATLGLIGRQDAMGRKAHEACQEGGEPVEKPESEESHEAKLETRFERGQEDPTKTGFPDR